MLCFLFFSITANKMQSIHLLAQVCLHCVLWPCCLITVTERALAHAYRVLKCHGPGRASSYIPCVSGVSLSSVSPTFPCRSLSLGASQVSYLIFLHSSLELEVVLVHHVVDRPKALRGEEVSLRIHERGYTRAAFSEVFYRPTCPLIGYQ